MSYHIYFEVFVNKWTGNGSHTVSLEDNSVSEEVTVCQ